MIHAQVKIKPSLHKIPYDSRRDEDELPPTPILSILQFTFRSGVDLGDTSQPFSTAKFFGVCVDNSRFPRTLLGTSEPGSASQLIIILIQWDSGLAWERFQCSIGFSMLLGYLETCYNRCIQLALPADLSSSSTLLELVSYRFPSGSSNLKRAEIDERILHFTAQWESMLNLQVVNDAAKLIAACGGWLEKDYKSENMYFAGLLFGSLTTKRTVHSVYYMLRFILRTTSQCSRGRQTQSSPLSQSIYASNHQIPSSREILSLSLSLRSQTSSTQS